MAADSAAFRQNTGNNRALLEEYTNRKRKPEFMKIAESEIVSKKASLSLCKNVLVQTES